MSIAQIHGLPRVRPVIELGVGDSRVHESAALWDQDKWDDPLARWSGIEPYWIDVTCYAQEAETFTGHERTTEVWEVGVARIVLNNNEGWADYPPTMAMPDTLLTVRPGVQVRVGVAVDGVLHPKWRGFVDQANPSFDPVLGDLITLECIDAKGEAGRGQLPKTLPTFLVANKVLSANVATLTIGAHSVQVGHQVTVTLTPPDPVFDGAHTVTSVSATKISYSQTNDNVASTPSGGTVLGAGVGGSEFVHERLARICDLQYWPHEWCDFEVSGVRLVATDFGQSAIDAMNRAADSGGGAIYSDIDGKLRYRNYGWQSYAADEPNDGSIGNVERSSYEPVPYTESPDGSRIYFPPDGVTITEDPPGSGVYTTTGPVTQIEDPRYPGLYTFGVYIVRDVCPVAWEPSFARADFSNRTIVGRSDMDEPLMIEDVPDRVAYGVEPFTLTDLETELPAELTNLAARILRARNFALAPRIAAVTLNAATAPEVVDLLATADPRKPTRLLCRHRGRNGRLVFNKECFVTGIRHRITPDAWETRLTLDDANPWRIGGEEARWDVGQWDVDDWAKTPTPI